MEEEYPRQIDLFRWLVDLRSLTLLEIDREELNVPFSDMPRDVH
jgi:hypothetical protein